MADCNWEDMKRVLDDMERRGARPQVFVFPSLLPYQDAVPTTFEWKRTGDAVQTYETEREIPCHFKMEVQLDARVPELPEHLREELAAQLQAALDRLIRTAIYGG